MLRLTKAMKILSPIGLGQGVIPRNTMDVITTVYRPELMKFMRNARPVTVSFVEAGLL